MSVCGTFTIVGAEPDTPQARSNKHCGSAVLSMLFLIDLHPFCL